MTDPPKLTVFVSAYADDPNFVIQVGPLAAPLNETEARDLAHKLEAWLAARQKARRLRYWRALVHRSAGWISPHRHNP
jgi:hypothetical protein